jgi:ribosomal protein L11 methyltransferase
MNHIQLSIEAIETEQEVLISQLEVLNATGFEQTDTHLIAYFEEDTFLSYEVHEVLKKFKFQISTVKEQNWNAAWEASFKPVVVEGFCAVRAHFHAAIPNVQHQIIITPKMSFGTGHHATTFMMLQGMQALHIKDQHILDFGTGTGILAILAEKLGAASVTAIDNDAWSFENVQENIQLNGCTKIVPLLTEIIPTGETYSIILANITKNVLLSYMDILKRCLQPGGQLLLSGLLTSDKEEMLAAAQYHGLTLIEEQQQTGWIALRFKKEL